MSGALLQVENLRKSYVQQNRTRIGRGARIVAVEKVSFFLNEGETLGLMGETGCGKTTLAKLLTGLEVPDEGAIYYKGRNLSELGQNHRREYKREVQLIFQNPYASLNPRWKVAALVNEPMVIHNVGDLAQRKEKVAEVLDWVGLSPKFLTRYPRELSGGQRQRVAIARSLVLETKLIVADEPVSALDMPTQRQILTIFYKLKNDLGISTLFITHNLNALHDIADRVAVMYSGRIVELLSAKQLFHGAIHPYTRSLTRAALKMGSTSSLDMTSIGQMGLEIRNHRLDRGCPYRLHCKEALPICAQEEPVIKQWKQLHRVACHLSTSFQ